MPAVLSLTEEKKPNLGSDTASVAKYQRKIFRSNQPKTVSPRGGSDGFDGVSISGSERPRALATASIVESVGFVFTCSILSMVD